MNFRLYDKDKYLGAIGCNQYIVYECDPGEHLFWAVSENRSFVKADIHRNKRWFSVVAVDNYIQKIIQSNQVA